MMSSCHNDAVVVPPVSKSVKSVLSLNLFFFSGPVNLSANTQHPPPIIRHNSFILLDRFFFFLHSLYVFLSFLSLFPTPSPCPSAPSPVLYRDSLPVSLSVCVCMSLVRLFDFVCISDDVVSSSLLPSPLSLFPLPTPPCPVVSPLTRSHFMCPPSHHNTFCLSVCLSSGVLSRLVRFASARLD